jgi:AmmeMemoRadiSam system protein B
MTIRPAAVAGSWYAGSARALTADVARYLAAAAVPPIAGRVVALVAPHAGLVYSGPVAAFAYKMLVDVPLRTAVLVGPAHRVAFEGVSVYGEGAFETPLGRAPIDESFAARLIAAHPLIVDAMRPHRDEHSLEMQLPFLQHVAPRAAIVPLLMGSQSRAEIDALAPALADAARGQEDVVLVASSDLSHYHPAPVANRMDAAVVDDVARFDAEALEARLERSHEHACGGGPIVAVMKAARELGATRATVLRYADSGDAGTGDKSRVVGYLAAAFTAPA